MAIAIPARIAAAMVCPLSSLDVESVAHVREGSPFRHRSFKFLGGASCLGGVVVLLLLLLILPLLRPSAEFPLPDVVVFLRRNSRPVVVRAFISAQDLLVGLNSGGPGRLLPGLHRLLVLILLLVLEAEGGVVVGSEVVGDGLFGRAGGPGAGGDVGGGATAGVLGRRPRRPLGGGCLRAGGGFAGAAGLG